MTAPPLYTIGHSNHAIEKFIALLKQHEIEVLADVRSTPFSRFNPHFNRQRLEQTLIDQGMRYLFLGEGLGARSPDPAHYDNGQVNYRKLAASAPFQRDLARLLSEAREHRTAIMCAEREPLDCHRTILVAREVERAVVPVQHILSDGSLQAHDRLMRKLTSRLNRTQSDLFDPPKGVVDEAYDRQASKIAYVKPQG